MSATTKSSRPARRHRRAQKAVTAVVARSTSDFVGHPLQRAIVATVTVKVALFVIAFAPKGFDAFQPPKVLASRVTEYVLVALVAMAIARFGLGVVPRTPTHALVAAYAIASALSLVVAEDRYSALFGDVTRLEGFTWVLDMLVLYAAVAVAFRTDRDWAWLAIGAAIATAVALIYALIQKAGLDPFHWAIDARARPIAMFGNPDIFGQYVSVAAGAAAGVALFWRARVRAAAAALLVAVVAIGSLTGTRGFLVGLGAILVTAPVVFLRAFGTARPVLLRVVVVGGAALAVLAVVVTATPAGARVISTITAGTQVNDRVILYQTALEAAAERPILGWGVDNFEPASVAHRQPDTQLVFGPQVPQTNAHNFVLQALATTGIAATAPLLLLFVFTAVTLWRALPERARVAGPLSLALAGYAAHGLVSVGSPGVDWAPWLVFGGAVALGDPEPPLPELRRVPTAVSIAVVILAAAAIMPAIPAYLANDHAGNAARLTLAGQHPAAVAEARAALDLDPGRARYWDRYGKAVAGAGRAKEAGDAFAEAARRAPYRFEYWSNLAVTRIQQAQSGDSSSGGLPAALAAAREGLAHDPDSVVLLYALAFAQAASGDDSAALQTVARAIALYPRDPAYDTLAAQSSARMSDAQAARRMLLDLLRVKDSAVLRVAEARVEIRLGDRAAARTQLRYVLEKLDPNNRDATALLQGLP